MYVSIYTNKCNMQCLDSGFNKLKMNDLIHVKMLIYSSKNVKKTIKPIKYNDNTLSCMCFGIL